MKTDKTTKKQRLFAALKQGQRLTPAQITKQFGIANPRAEVTRIRQDGFAVYANSRRAANGRVVTEYVMGPASRKIVAAGYRAIQLGLV
jgi:hypothetical protein